MVTDNYIEGVGIMKIAKLIIIDHQTKILINWKGLDNLNMILKEKAPAPMKLDDHNMNMVNPVVHWYQIATFAEKMVIMQTNVPLKTWERHRL